MAEQDGQSSRTKSVAEYVARARYGDLPPPVASVAKSYVLDSLANMIGGARLAPGRVYLELYEAMGGTPEATILATGRKVPCLHAVYVHGNLANMLDFDDVYMDIGHPGATVVPAAFGVAEMLGRSGRDLLAAVVVGYEVSLRVCDAINLALGYEGRMMQTWQTFGAMAAAANLLGLSSEQVVDALGHAGASAPVPSNMGLEPEDRPVTQLKHHFGWAAMGGVQAALLAARGLRGHKRILDSPRSFWGMLPRHAAAAERLTAGLGEEYLTPLIGLKPFSACRQTHATLSALHDLLAEHPVRPEAVERVVVTSMPSIPRAFDVRAPADVIDAEFSVPPLVALTLAGHSPTHGLALERLRDHDVQRLMARVELRERPDAARVFETERFMPSTVTVELADGTKLEGSCGAPPGEHQQPIPYEATRAKFVELVEPVIGRARAERTAALVDRLETLENVAEIADA